MKKTRNYNFGNPGFIEIKDFNFGDLSKEVVRKIFTDGRASSKLMEHSFAKKLGYKVVSGDKDHDLISKKNRHFEVKAFTKNGCNFGPSMHTGDKGLAVSIRKLSGEEGVRLHNLKKQKELFDRAANNIYLIYDLEAFPKMSYIAVKGYKLLKEFTNGKISKIERETLFEKS